MSSAAVGWVLHLISAIGESGQCKVTLTLQCFAGKSISRNLEKQQELCVINRPARNARILVVNSNVIVLIETEDCNFVSCWFLKFSVGSKVSFLSLGKPQQLESLPVDRIDDALIQNYKIYIVAGGKLFVSTDIRYIDRFVWIESKCLITDSTRDWGVCRDYFNILCASANPEILRKVLRSFSFNDEIGQTPMSQVASAMRQGVRMDEFLSRLRQSQTEAELTGIAKISTMHDSPIFLFRDGWGYVRDLDMSENVQQKSPVIMGISPDLRQLINRAMRIREDGNIELDDALNIILQHPGEGMWDMLLRQLEHTSQANDNSLDEEKQYCAETPLDDLVENQLIGAFSKGIEVITFEELGTVLASRFIVLTRVLVYLAINCFNSNRFPRLESTIRRMLFLRVVAVELSSGSKSNWQKNEFGDEVNESWLEARKLLDNEFNLWTLDCFKFCVWAWKEKSWRCLKVLAVILGGISKTRLANVFLAKSILGIRFHDNIFGLTWASGLYSPSELFRAFWEDLSKPNFVDELSQQEKTFLFDAIDPDSSVLNDDSPEHKIKVAFGEFVVRELQSISAHMSMENDHSATEWYIRLSKFCKDSGESNNPVVNKAIAYQITAVERYLRQLDFDSAQKLLTEIDPNLTIRASQQKMDALRLFVKTACEKRQIGAIVGPDWKSMTAMVEKGIKDYCKMKSSYQFHSHEVLWAFYVSRDKYEKAAQMMLVQLKRLEAKALKLPKTHLAHNVDRQLHCMANLINALSLLPKEKRSVSILKRTSAGEAKQEEPTREVCTYDDCIRRYRVLVG